MTFACNHRDAAGKWKSADSFSRTDLLLLAKAGEQGAHSGSYGGHFGIHVAKIAADDTGDDDRLFRRLCL
jgi:hypothetical protein